MGAKLPLQQGNLVGQLLVSGKHFSKLDECPNNENADPHGFGGIQHTGRHNGAMLREDEWHGLGELEVLNVSQFAITSAFSSGASWNMESSGKRVRSPLPALKGGEGLLAAVLPKCVFRLLDLYPACSGTAAF